jgi:hypothetical protein
MKKRLNIEGITNELEGASAYFTRPTPPPAGLPIKSDAADAQPPPSQPAPVSDTREALPEKQAVQQATKPTTNQTSNIASNITILQLFDETDIANLREPAYQAQTFRLTEQEIEWVKDTAYRLNKEMKRKKVSQADVLRISFKLFERLLATHKTELLAILERIK